MNPEETNPQNEAENENGGKKETTEKPAKYSPPRVKLKFIDKLLNPSFLLKKGSSSPSINEGYLFQKMGKFDEAMAAFNEAIAEDKQCIDAHIGMGKTLSMMDGIKNAKKSIVFFNNALKIDATRLEIYKDVINLYERLGDKKNAAAERKKQFIAKTLKSNPHDFKANNNLGVIQLNQGNINASIESFKKSIKKNRGFLVARSNLANAYLQKSDKVKSEEDKETLVKKSLQLINQVLDKEETAENFLLKAKILLSKEDFKEAAESCDRAIAKDPANKEAFNTKRVIEERLGNISKASQAYENYQSMNQNEQKEAKKKFESPFD